jgi:hypothetical protein
MRRMARKDFYDIKGLGEMPSDTEVEAKHLTLPHAARPYKAPKRKSYGRSMAIVLVVLIVLAALGGGAYWFAKHHNKTASKPLSAPAKVAPALVSSNGSTQYVSNGSDLNLSLSYPSSWVATPASGGNSNDQTITLASPLTSITNASGATVTGKAIVTIRPGSASLSELSSNTATAAAASAQFAYTSPTADQSQYPYLTFIHVPTASSVAGSFDEVLVSGTTTFVQGEAIDTSSLVGLDPIIAATFTTCHTTACSGSSASPLSITSSTWTSAPVFTQVQAIFASLKLN